MSKKKALLMILDGWGIGDKSKSDVISTAGAPNMEQLTANYAHAQLLTSGEDVGLPDGQMGNSEVGHLNIGAGRVVYQDLVRINLAIRDKSIEKNEIIVEAFNYGTLSGIDRPWRRTCHESPPVDIVRHDRALWPKKCVHSRLNRWPRHGPKKRVGIYERGGGTYQRK